MMRFLGCVFFMLCVTAGLFAQRKTSVSVTMSGYHGKVVDFEFVEDGGLNQQFGYVDNNPMSFEVSLRGVSLMKINNWVWVLLSAGDKLQAKIDYEDGRYRHAEFTGTPSAVSVNEAIQEMRNLRMQDDGYKMNPLAAIATQTTVADYYQRTLKEWKEELDLLRAQEKSVRPEAYAYIYSEIEGILLSNLVRYPHIYADVFKKNLSDCLPDDYWTVLDGYELRGDKASLRSRSYISFLLDYKEYYEGREAVRQQVEYCPYPDMKSEYESIVSFYKGQLQECALFVFLYNKIVRGQHFQEIEPLVADYLKNYNRDKTFRKMLSEMMQ